VPTQSNPSTSPASSASSALTSPRPLRISKRFRNIHRRAYAKVTGSARLSLKVFARMSAWTATASEIETSPAALDRKGDLHLAPLAWHWLAEHGLENTIGTVRS
jgi:hypothetical protein